MCNGHTQWVAGAVPDLNSTYCTGTAAPSFCSGLQGRGQGQLQGRVQERAQRRRNCSTAAFHEETKASAKVAFETTVGSRDEVRRPTASEQIVVGGAACYKLGCMRVALASTGALRMAGR